MKNKIFLLGLFSLILIVITSCQKENDTVEDIIYQNNAKLKRTLLFSAFESGKFISIVAEYEYDEEDRISKVSKPRYEDGEIAGIISYHLYDYNSLGQLIRVEYYHANINSPTGFRNLKNYIYTYSEDGKKEKEIIENTPKYSLYKYINNRLAGIEKYTSADNLESYVVNEYDNSGNLAKETSFAKDNRQISYTQHLYKNGLNIQSDVFAGKNKEHAREIFRTYDINNNLIILESNELSPFSSYMSHVLKYEYFEE